MLLGQRQVHQGAEVVAHKVHTHPDHVAGHHQRHGRVDAVAHRPHAGAGEQGAGDEGDQHAAVGHHADEVVGLVRDEERRGVLGAPHEPPRQREEHSAGGERDRDRDEAGEVLHLGSVDEPFDRVEQHVEAGRDVEHAAEECGEVLELAGAVGVAVRVVLEHLAHGVHGEGVDDQRDGGLRREGDEGRRPREHGARRGDDDDGDLDDQAPAQQRVQAAPTRPLQARARSRHALPLDPCVRRAAAPARAARRMYRQGAAERLNAGGGGRPRRPPPPVPLVCPGPAPARPGPQPAVSPPRSPACAASR